MTATNHGLMGIVIGAYLPLPYAIPLAFASHFILDALPHYGIPHGERNKSMKYKTIVTLDTLTALVFAGLAAYFGKWTLFWIGWLAYCPDLMWVASFLTHKGNLHLKPKNAIARFHKNIQWLERPWGAYVEAVLFFFLATLSLRLILS